MRRYTVYCFSVVDAGRMISHDIILYSASIRYASAMRRRRRGSLCFDRREGTRRSRRIATTMHRSTRMMEEVMGAMAERWV